MKKFRYSMENLLQVKIKLEDQAKISYSNARALLTKEEEKLKLLRDRKAEYENELRGLSAKRLDLLKIRHCKDAIEIMELKIKNQIVAVKNATLRLEAERVKLNEAMIERKTQESLKEKAFSQYLLELDAEERKEVDERNSFQFSKPALSEEDG